MAVLKISPRQILGKGRGLIAREAIAAGDLIDDSPTILLSAADCDLMERSAVGDYYFAHPEDSESGLVVLGLISLCNHSDTPNAELRWRHEDGVGWVAELYALRPIAATEEVTRRYRCRPWFEVAS
ncbi:MAG: SET domain-containing protein-lysine N-methyltransferase [Alphaproteobacteria bacterium]|nr:SET domain-containing protein-lysine N-methyltransferase [Alphaproteobacteria bacterium]